VTVLFADISGFTAMSEVLDPEDVHEIMNACFEELASVVHRYGGTVDKFIGDAVMALFGAPNAHEDDAERAVAAALEMRQGLQTVCDRLGERLPQRLELHVGINTGLVVAGQVGSLARSDYTVLGDTVNLAARLEDASENGQILVADGTYRMTEHAFAYTPLPPIAVKGKREPVPVYLVDGIRAERRSGRGLPGLTAPFVGRTPELEALNEALTALIRGQGGLITVGGPAGVGKSRLLRELRGRVEGRSVQWVQAGTSSLGQGGALTIWADAIRRVLAGDANGQQPPPEPDDTLQTKDPAALAEVLGMTVSPAEQNRLGRLDDSALRGGLFLAVRDLLIARATRQPLVIVLEDLHWADEASFELLRFVSAARPPRRCC
jgi:class 3 adenylate cyclase